MSAYQMTADRYRDHVRDYAELARQLRAAEPGISRERLEDELHEMLSAPDGLFHWSDEDSTEDVALSILRHSAHRQAGAGHEGIAAGGEVNFEFLAAHALVADILASLEIEPACATEGSAR
jgi:tRNA nucleotidyltransferase/poly(A) polymerase